MADSATGSAPPGASSSWAGGTTGTVGGGRAAFDSIVEVCDLIAIKAVEADFKVMQIGNGGSARGDAIDGWQAYDGHMSYVFWASPLTGKFPDGMDEQAVRSRHPDAFIVVDNVLKSEPSGMGAEAPTVNLRHDAYGMYEGWLSAINDLFEPWKSLAHCDESSIEQSAAELGRQVRSLSLGVASDLYEKQFKPGQDNLQELAEPGWAGEVNGAIQTSALLTGRTMETFRHKFVVPMPWTLSNIQLLMLSTGCGIYGQAGVIRQTKEAVGNVLASAVEAMDSVTAGGGGVKATTTLMILGAAAAAASTFVSGPVGLAGAAALASTALGVTKDAVSGGLVKKEVDLGSGSASAVFAGIGGALQKANEYMRAEEDAIWKSLPAWSEAVAAAPDDFGVPKTVGHFTEEAEIAMTKHAVTTVQALLERVHDQVRGVARSVNVAEGPYVRDSRLGVGTSGAFMAIDGLWNLAEDVAVDYSNQLRDGSEMLGDAFRMFQRTDGDVGDGFRRFTETVGDGPGSRVDPYASASEEGAH
jgi:hypothetical protein